MLIFMATRALGKFESVREVATVAVDLANSSTSRDFLRKVDATADVDIVGHCADMQEAANLIHKRHAYCLIYIPADFDQALMEGRQAIVELYSDMGSLLYYKAVLSSCTEVSFSLIPLNMSMSRCSTHRMASPHFSFRRSWCC